MKKDTINFTMEELSLIESVNQSCLGEKVTAIKCIENYKQEYKPEDILIAREERVYKQESLLEKYKNTILTIRVNYPGINKNNYISLSIIKILCDLIIKKFEEKILHREFNVTAEGPIITMIINKEPSKVKFKAVSIEEQHPLGRCVDIDIYDEDGKGLSRSELGLAKRKCYICNDFAQNCVRSRKHSLYEIEEFIKSKLEYYKHS